MSGYSHQRRSTFVTTWIREKFLNFQSLLDFRIMGKSLGTHKYCKMKTPMHKRICWIIPNSKKQLGVLLMSVRGGMDGISWGTFVLCVLYSCQKSELDFYLLPPKDDLSVVDEKTSHRKNVCGISPFKKEGGYLLFMHVCVLWGGRASEACTPNLTLVISGGMGFGRT